MNKYAKKKKRRQKGIFVIFISFFISTVCSLQFALILQFAFAASVPCDHSGIFAEGLAVCILADLVDQQDFGLPTS